MTALSLDLMDITIDWFSTFVRLYQALTAATVVVFLWVFLYSESEMHAQSG